MSILPCPVCNSLSTEELLNLNCGNLDGSKLYENLRLTGCIRCGHVYNDLMPEEISGLVEYYNYEYAPANLNSIVKEGDLPGSSGNFTHNRYDQLFNMLSPHIHASNAILDVGCAVGGFLDFLKEREFFNLYGVDMTEAYIKKAREKNYKIEFGSAERLPYEDDSFNALVIEQVLEHLVNPVVAFREAARVLKKGGVLCIGVPDAARYSDLYYFDFYWLLMREHIQHFDIKSLSLLAAAEGFEVAGYQQTSHPIMGDKMIMPNLSALFKLKDGDNAPVKAIKSDSNLSENIKKYIDKELSRLSEKKTRLKDIINSQRPVYAWGIGREFLYLYKAGEINKCNLAGLIDMNPFKQQSVTVNTKRVESPEILNNATEDSVLVITAIAHEAAIIQYVAKSGFRGEIFNLS